MRTRVTIVPILLWLLPVLSSAQAGDSLRVYLDFPNPGPEGLYHDLLLETALDGYADIEVRVFKYNENHDSLLVLSEKKSHYHIQKGLSTISFNYKSNFFIQPDFKRIISTHHLIPPANYVTYVKLGDSLTQSTFTFYHAIDSLLPMQSSLRSNYVSGLLKLRKGKELEAEFERIADKKNIQSKVYRKGGMIYADLYDGSWFMGRYQVSAVQDLKKQLEQESKQIRELIDFLVKNIFHPQSFSGNFLDFRKNQSNRNPFIEYSGRAQYWRKSTSYLANTVFMKIFFFPNHGIELTCSITCKTNRFTNS